MHFSIQHGTFSVVIEGNVTETLKKVSQAFNGEEVWVFALNRGRLSAIDGEIVQDLDDVTLHYDLSVFPASIQQLIQKQWKDLLVGEVTTSFHLRRLPYAELWPEDPLKWATYRHLVGRVRQDTVFYVDGVVVN